MVVVESDLDLYNLHTNYKLYHLSFASNSSPRAFAFLFLLFLVIARFIIVTLPTPVQLVAKTRPVDMQTFVLNTYRSKCLSGRAS